MNNEKIDELANMLAYNEQDLLDSLAQGGRFNFKQEEKKIKKMIVAALKSEKKEASK